MTISIIGDSKNIRQQFKEPFLHKEATGQTGFQNPLAYPLSLCRFYFLFHAARQDRLKLE